jgi:hypothetical protein
MSESIMDYKGVGVALSKIFKHANILTVDDFTNEFKTSDDITTFAKKHKINGSAKGHITKVFNSISSKKVKDPSQIISEYMILSEEVNVTQSMKLNMRNALLKIIVPILNTTEKRNEARKQLKEMNSIFYVDDIPMVCSINKVKIDMDTKLDNSIYEEWKESKMFNEGCRLAMKSKGTKHTKNVVYLAIIKFTYDSTYRYFHYIGKAKNGIVDRWRRSHVNDIVSLMADPYYKNGSGQLVDTMIALTTPNNIMLFIIAACESEEEMEKEESKFIKEYACFNGLGACFGLNLIGGKK